MSALRIPNWVNACNHKFGSYREIPGEVFAQINGRLKRLQSDAPLVSVVIAAWNEEVNILNCIDSLSRMETVLPLEIIVINNNSTDHTDLTLKRLDVGTFLQPIQGPGPARELGQQQSRGKYILLADADCLYPPTWVDDMIGVLKKPKVVCAYGRYSFLPDEKYPRWKLYLLEKMKDMVAELRHFKRPYLNAYGMSMGYIAANGRAIGFVDHNIRGEDGRMCFDLMKFGKIKQMKANRSRVWTAPRTLQSEGSFAKVLFNRIRKEIKRLFSLFRPLPEHDTKTSENY
ncbi:glycosyltransferase family 2 protein [Parapedobacter deserti]|uniref:Glycosyltransferase family 2 protein n=1 Tax=Parapedobacter deserti TaxID=1912957 RepID=A0ABV7JH31_9SPHI